jgi:uncharacterized protein YndB with AHSA1/START domain
MKEIPCPKDRLVVCGDFGGFPPEDLFRFWTDPELVVRWWPKVATIDPRVGGSYQFSWKETTLYGEYTAFEPGQHLGFTWCWSNLPTDQEEPHQVDLYFMPLDDGTRLSIFQGPFGDTPEDQEARQGVLEGWIHFGMLLAGQRDGRTV